MTAPTYVRRPRRRRELSMAAAESARAVFAELGHGDEILCLTHGQFSLTDAIAAILDRTGPADVCVSTWSAAAADLEHAKGFLSDGRIRSLRFVVDRSFLTRQPAYCAALRELFGDAAIRTTRVHAKFATIRNESWDIAVRTSMNLNENPRLEYLEVSDDPDVAAFFVAAVDEIYRTAAEGDFGDSPLPSAGRRIRPPQDARAEAAALLARVRRV